MGVSTEERLKRGEIKVKQDSVEEGIWHQGCMWRNWPGKEKGYFLLCNQEEGGEDSYM